MKKTKIINVALQEKLEVACSSGKFFDAKKLLTSKNVDVNYPNAEGWTPLMVACYFGDLAIVKLLVESGADVALRDGYGANCLFFASAIGSENHVDTIEYLIDRCTPDVVNVEDAKGLTPLFCAVEGNHKKIVEMLINAGADVTYENQNGRNIEYYFQKNDADRESIRTIIDKNLITKDLENIPLSQNTLGIKKNRI